MRFALVLVALVLGSGVCSAKQTLSDLNARFAKSGRIAFRPDAKGEPVVELADSNGSCAIALRGAHVLSCRFAGDAHPLFLTPKKGYFAAEPHDFVYGGMPLVWPWFGTAGRPDDAFWRRWCRALWLPVKPAPPEHGTARLALFGVKSVEADGPSTSVTLELSRCADEVADYTDAFFRLEYTVTLGPHRLGLRLKTTNTGKHPFAYREGYHPFFAVSNSFMTSLEGVDGCSYASNRELPYDDTGVWRGKVPVWTGCDIFHFNVERSVVTLCDAGWKRNIVLSSIGARDVLLWSFGAKGARRGGRMNILPEECIGFVCVEPASINDDSEIVLGPTASHVLDTEIAVVPR